jgi:TPP-dependent pyruvate/acetoin dehydrogenase alpha subunit
MMVLIRRYEEHLYQLFLQVPGTLHQCQGQEAVAVGVCSALRRDDLVSTDRPVGHLIAKGASLEATEIWGKVTGCVGGKGGQMHLADFAAGAMVRYRRRQYPDRGRPRHVVPPSATRPGRRQLFR